MPISIRLPDDIEARLTDLSAKTGRTKTFYVTQAICEHLDDLEDIYLAERELIEVRAGRSVPVSLQDVMTAYGLED
ncbi:MAG TPA: TraY domain-containing protein [Caulobacteraceae bacterium]